MEENRYTRDHETTHRTSEARSRTARQSAARRKARKSSGGILTPARLILLAVIVIAVVVLVFVLKGCMKNKNSATGIAEKLVEESVAGKTDKMAACYALSGEPGAALTAELEGAAEYYAAHNAQKLSIVKSDILYEDEAGETAYVYVRYNLVLEDEQEYPCLRTFMTQKVEDKWKIVETSAVTDAMQEQAEEAFNKFMTSDTYKEFNKDYETFLKKNPGYEERVSTKLM